MWHQKVRLFTAVLPLFGSIGLHAAHAGGAEAGVHAAFNGWAVYGGGCPGPGCQDTLNAHDLISRQVTTRPRDGLRGSSAWDTGSGGDLCDTGIVHGSVASSQARHEPQPMPQWDGNAGGKSSGKDGSSHYSVDKDLKLHTPPGDGGTTVPLSAPVLVAADEPRPLLVLLVALGGLCAARGARRRGHISPAG